MTPSSSGTQCDRSRRRLAGQLVGLSSISWALGLPSAAVARAKGGVLSVPFRNQTSLGHAPFGNQVTNAIHNYNRVSPYVATAGLLHRGGLQLVVELGFKVLIDLRGADEKGVEQEAREAARIGLRRLHMPVTTRAPLEKQVVQFAALVEDPANYPMLVHCVSANRTGALWSLYRASTGVDPVVAIEEGKAAGLASREGAVRSLLGLG